MNNTAVKQEKSAPKRAHKGASLNARKARMGWIFVLPFVIGLLLVYLPVMFESLSYSFANYNKVAAIQGGGYTLTWVGFDNYKEVFSMTVDASSGETFIEMLFKSLGSQAIDIIAILMLSLFIAVLLNTKMVGRAAFRAIFFIPVVVGAGIITRIDATSAEILATASGVLEGIDQGAVEGGGFGSIASAMDMGAMFENLGIGGGLVGIVSDLVTNIFNIVNRSGVQMLIFLAGLQSISPSVYESCEVEGASAWEIFWKITLPMLSPMILTNAIYTVIDAFTSESNVVMINILGEELTLSPDPIQSAKAWLYFAVVALALILVSAICSSFVFYQRRNDD
ncbi:MAG: sugar ABC transporter permease [Ruminococcaceae bacterium]|nr:sugar ABC transporter permease [Oscillospiraceae bacterium]MBO5005843.1 sugar ABC transporter permease [Clostridia bacterium]